MKMELKMKNLLKEYIINSIVNHSKYIYYNLLYHIIEFLFSYKYNYNFDWIKLIFLI